MLCGGIGVRAQLVEIDRNGESLASGIALTARREEPRGSRCMRGERIRRAAADIEDIRKFALGLCGPTRVPCTPAQIDDLPPNRDRLRGVAREVEAATEPRECVHTLRLVIASGPELESAADETCGVAVRVNRTVRLCGLEQERPRDLRPSRRERVGRDRLGGRSALGQDGRKLAVELPPARPRRFRIDRFAREGVPKGGEAVRLLDDQAAGDRFVDPRTVRQGIHDVQLEHRSQRRRDLESRSHFRPDAVEAGEDGVAHGVGKRHSFLVAEPQPVFRSSEAPGRRQGSRDLFNEERHTLCSVPNRRRERRRERRLEDRRRELRRLPALA